MHGSTFGGNAMACRVALEFFEVLDELMPTIRETGVYFRSRLNELTRKFAFAKEVRGEGLMIGLELTEPGKQVVNDCLSEGLLINCTHEVVLRFLPPYIIGKREVDSALKILTKVLKQQKW
jgi:acetylornithine/succinyldiaminopimelate/putrescine aminotransferase